MYVENTCVQSKHYESTFHYWYIIEYLDGNSFVTLGYCTEYNVMGRVIQENYDANCTTHDPPCPAIYNSTDAYKCKF